MKRLLLPVLVALCGVALGAATVAKLNTYSYVPDAMNEPCNKTVFEWRLLEGRIDTTPVSLNDDFSIIRLETEAKPSGLIVRAYLRPKNPSAIPASNPAWKTLASELAFGAGKLAYKRLKLPHQAPGVFVLVHIEDRLIGITGGDKTISLAPDATREQQLAALAKIMSHAPPP